MIVLLGLEEFGLELPDVQRWLFPLMLDVAPGVTVTHPTLTALHVLGQVGLVFHMSAGLSFDPRRIADHVRSSVVASPRPSPWPSAGSSSTCW